MTNKEYRNIPGYEDALYMATDMEDQCGELAYAIRHGQPVKVIRDEVNKISDILNRILEVITDDKPTQET